MSALLTPRRAPGTGREKPRGPAEQPPPFGAVPAAALTTPAAAAAPESATTETARRHGPTLDDLVAGAWEGLLTGAPAECLACGSPMAPRHSAGAGVVGGRCGGCGSTLG
jgi:hypothetical protein